MPESATIDPAVDAVGQRAGPHARDDRAEQRRAGDEPRSERRVAHVEHVAEEVQDVRVQEHHAEADPAARNHRHAEIVTVAHDRVRNGRRARRRVRDPGERDRDDRDRRRGRDQRAVRGQQRRTQQPEHGTGERHRAANPSGHSPRRARHDVREQGLVDRLRGGQRDRRGDQRDGERAGGAREHHAGERGDVDGERDRGLRPPVAAATARAVGDRAGERRGHRDRDRGQRREQREQRGVLARSEPQQERGNDDREERGVLELDTDPQQVQRGVVAPAKRANRCPPTPGRRRARARRARRRRRARAAARARRRARSCRTTRASRETRAARRAVA